MVKREKFKIKRKKGKVANISLVLFTLVLIITLITISYARWTTTLTIEGTAIAKEPELPVEPVKPSTDSDRFSTNTSFQAGWLNREVFKVVEDTVEGNVITTKLANGSKTSFITPTMTATFTLTIQNNSGSTYTDGTVTYTKEDPQGYITPSTPTLSKQTISSGESTTLTCKVQFKANANINVGSYIQYKIEFTSSNGQKQSYYYKILISE